jgi:hypothetical protein
VRLSPLFGDASSPPSFRGARSASYDAQLRIGESITTIGGMDFRACAKRRIHDAQLRIGE